MAAAYYGASMFAMASAPRGIQPIRKPRLSHCLQQFVATSAGVGCMALNADCCELVALISEIYCVP